MELPEQSWLAVYVVSTRERPYFRKSICFSNKFNEVVFTILEKSPGQRQSIRACIVAVRSIPYAQFRPNSERRLVI